VANTNGSNIMFRLPIEIKEKAFELRKKGYSIKEIAKKLNIAKSTSSLWLREIKLNKRAQERLKKRKLLSYYKSSLRWVEKRNEQENKLGIESLKIVNKINKDINHSRIYCSLLYWCEGGKGYKESIKFVNSDPVLINVFLKLFRKSFVLNEDKFRIMMHLHVYHDEKKQKEFWSRLTRISKKQFMKTFHKHNTGKRIRENYPGCIAVYYYDCKIARELRNLYKIFSEQMGP